MSLHGTTPDSGRHPQDEPGRSARELSAPHASAPVRVGLVGAGALGQAGLATLLGPYPDRCALVVGGPTVRPRDVDVVMVDAERLGSRTADRVHELFLSGFDPIVTFASRTDQRQLLLDAGSRAHVPSTLAASELVRALERVARTSFGSAAHQCPAQSLRQVALELAGCSAREAEVLGLVALGLSNQQIAERLYLSLNTVKTYIRTAYRKIGVTTRAGAVVWGIERGVGESIRAELGDSLDVG